MKTMEISHPWLRISLLGTARVESHGERRSLILANQMGGILLVLSVVLLSTSLLLIPGNTVVISWLTVLCFSLACSLMLNRLGKYRFTQLLLGTGLPLVLILSTIHSKLHHPELIHTGSYYNPRYFLLGLSILPFVVFELRDRYLGFSVALNILMLITYPLIHELLGAAPHQIGVEAEDMRFAVVASSSAGLAIVAGMFFFKLSNARYEERIRELLQIADARNRETEAAIRYARKLQETVIPFSHQNGQLSATVALFNRPRDIVSGDFPLSIQEGDLEYACVCDCTGHGVPGAFISLMAYSRLTAAIREVQQADPADILQRVHQHLSMDLKKHHSSVNDGLDLSLCAIDRSKKLIRYSSARGLAYLLGKSGLIRLESERRSICDDSMAPFISFEQPFEEGDVLILLSDGYSDQFGGPDFKKFGRKRLEEFIPELYSLSPSKMSFAFGAQFDRWKNQHGQTDDVMVMCVRL